MKGFESWVKEIDPNGSWTRAQMDSAKAIFKAGYEAGIASEREVATDMPIIQDIFDYFIEKTSKRHNLSKSRISLIRARLRGGYTVEQLKSVIDYAASKWLGKRPAREGGFNGNVKTDINVLFGSSQKVDKYLGLWDDILERDGSKPKDKPKDTVITRKVDSDIKPSFM